MDNEIQETGGEQIPEESQETVQESQEPQEQVPQEAGELQSLKEQFENLQKKIGEQGEELGKLRNENAFYRNQGQMPQGVPQGMPQGIPQPQAYPPNPYQAGSLAGNTNVPDEYDPYDQASVDRYINSRLGVVDQKLNQFAQWQHHNMVNSALARGQGVLQQNPEYFKGIENEVVNFMQNIVQTAPNINPAILENPTTWYAYADVIKGEKMRKSPSTVNPVQAAAVDTPSAVRQPDMEQRQDDIQISQEIVDTFYGGDRKKAIEATRQERGRR